MDILFGVLGHHSLDDSTVSCFMTPFQTGFGCFFRIFEMLEMVPERNDAP